jgi:hypothetical protein
LNGDDPSPAVDEEEDLPIEWVEPRTRPDPEDEALEVGSELLEGGDE